MDIIVSDSQTVIALLENQVTDLKTQFAQTSDGKSILVSEKSKLLNMPSAAQEKTQILMLPTPKKKQGFFDFCEAVENVFLCPIPL